MDGNNERGDTIAVLATYSLAGGGGIYSVPVSFLLQKKSTWKEAIVN